MERTLKELEEMSELLSIAVAREEASIEFYSKAFDKAVFESARRTFSGLIEEERKHELRLREHLKDIKSEIQLALSKGGRTQR